MEIGDTIRFFRELKGYSQQGLADCIGVSQKTISRLETGNTSPSLNLLQSICEELDIEISSLLKSKSQLMNKLTDQPTSHSNDAIIKELYENLIKEKDRHIAALEQELRWLKQKDKSNEK